MIEIKGSTKEQKVRQWFNDNFEGIVPNSKVIDLFKRFEVEVPGISYGCLNGTMKKIMEEGHVGVGNDAPVRDIPVKTKEATMESLEISVVKVEDLDFPNFKLHNTGKAIDTLFSDHEEGGGLYGGTVTIVIGESGVGKSTVLLDVLASVQEQNPDAKILYVSSEMTKNDIAFYYKKTPAIGKVPTLLLMNHVSDGTLDLAIEKKFSEQYDIILLDSYQDVVVKLKEVKGWRSTQAESWLTNIMIESAEKNGSAILAIQHMTKGGQYVGSTYLKHATTAMLELLFDDAGHRYIVFSKNRRGGSNVGKRLYFNLDEKGDIIYDENRFKETQDLKEIEDKEMFRQSDLSRKFEDMFITKKPSDSVVNDVDESIELEVVNPEAIDEN